MSFTGFRRTIEAEVTCKLRSTQKTLSADVLTYCVNGGQETMVADTESLRAAIKLLYVEGTKIRLNLRPRLEDEE